jgi:hypothetical protein
MNYPKMLYKGEPVYTDSHQIKDDLFSKKLQTIIVSDEVQESLRREHGYVDLFDLMYKPKPNVIEFPKVNGPGPSGSVTAVKQKRKYTRKVPNVSLNPA